MTKDELTVAVQENVTLVGRKSFGESNEGIEICEELYVAESGSYWLIGSYGISDSFLDGGEFDAWCLPDKQEYLRLSYGNARYWAARYLTDEEYNNAFGRRTRLEKILNNIKPNDLCELFLDVLECRAIEGFTKEEFAESTGINAKKTYPGFSGIGMYELAERMWDFCDPVSAYPEEAEKEKEAETVPV